MPIVRNFPSESASQLTHGEQSRSFATKIFVEELFFPLHTARRSQKKHNIEECCIHKFIINCFKISKYFFIFVENVEWKVKVAQKNSC